MLPSDIKKQQVINISSSVLKGDQHKKIPSVSEAQPIISFQYIPVPNFLALQECYPSSERQINYAQILTAMFI